MNSIALVQNGLKCILRTINKQMFVVRLMAIMLLMTSIHGVIFSQHTAANEIHGHVKDSVTGMALVGASVRIKGNTIGTLTDKNGNFDLNAPKDAILEVQYIGYATKDVSVQGQNSVDVLLTLSSGSLEQVIVVGYGTQKKNEVTGAISSVTSDALKDIPAAGLQQSLEGKSAGVQITQNSGSPGKNAEVRIRGLTSINNSDVLYVVDGVPLTANGINAIDPSDIASIQILKDASSQAIYGSRGANGVILIETKKGAKNTSNIYVNVYEGMQQVRKTLKLLDSKDYIELNTEAYENAGQTSAWGDSAQYYTKTTNWQDAMFRTAPIQSYDLAFSGGSDKLTYRLSGNYFNQDGIIIGSQFKRASLSLNTTFRPMNGVEVGENVSIAKSTQYLVGEGATSRVDLIDAVSMDPTVPIQDSAGNYLPTRHSDIQNPIASIHYVSMNHPYDNWAIVGATYLQIKPVNGLTLKSNLSIDLNFSDNKAFLPSYFVSPSQNNPIPSLSQTKALGYSWTWDNTATYEKKINKDNTIKFLAGISQQRFSYDYLTGANQGQPGNDAYLQYLDAGTANPTVGGSKQEWSLLSYIGRLNYNFKEKYFLTATIRRDGSSKFGVNNRYGNFPSVSVGWALNKEQFLENVKSLNSLMLRASWGIVGNQSSAGYYDFASTINNYFYPFGSPASAALTAEPNGLGNPNLKWEQVRQWDLGLDFKIFNDLSGTIDYYNKKTNNMLLAIPILFESGFSTGPLTNVASMLNSGFEFQVDYTHTVNKNLTINAGANLSTLYNKVLNLENQGAQIFNSPNLTRAGNRIAEFYGYVFDGIFQTEDDVKNHATQPNAAPGDIRYKDLNNDGVIDDKDQTFIGSPIPKIQYGFNLGASYKGFDLGLNFYGVYGNKIYQSYKFNTNGFFVSNYNMEKEVLGRWHGEGTSNRIPRLNANDPNDNARASSFYLASGSYLRLSNVTVGYTFPKELMQKWKMKGLRLYVSAQNLLTFTSYDGYDPEIGITYGGNAGSLQLGEDDLNYPQPRIFTAGINITL